VKRATVHVDLANKSAVIIDADGITQHGAWATDITRDNVEDHIAADGWMFADDSEWHLTIDGGVREVVQTDELLYDDLLLDIIGSAIPTARDELAADDLCARLLSARDKAEKEPIPALVPTECARTVITLARAA
jgi:hypothetical protein